MSRKLLVVFIGGFVLVAGSAAAALMFAGDALLGPPEETIIGGECVDIQTMVVKTPSDQFWLRKFVRMDSTDGPTRVKTALRVAGLLAKDNAVDLVHVSIIDTKGPVKRSGMRARAIGAEVLFALHPEKLPDMKQPVVARYYDGSPNAAGEFFGKRVELDLGQIKTMMMAMRSVEDKTECTEPVVEGAEEKKPAHAPKKSHEKKPSAHDAPAEGDHAATPAEGEHAATPAEGEHAATPAEGEKPAGDKGFLDSMLSMVGLGSGDPEPVAAEHATPDAGEHKTTTDGEHAAPAEGDHNAATEANHAAPPESEHAAPAEEPAKDGEHAATVPAEGEHAPAETTFDTMLGVVGIDGKAEAATEGEHATEAAADDHAAASEDDKPVAEKGMLDSMMTMVGLGGDEPASVEPAKDEHPAEAAQAATDDNSHADPAPAVDAATKHPADPTEGDHPTEDTQALDGNTGHADPAHATDAAAEHPADPADDTHAAGADSDPADPAIAAEPAAEHAADPVDGDHPAVSHDNGHESDAAPVVASNPAAGAEAVVATIDRSPVSTENTALAEEPASDKAKSHEAAKHEAAKHEPVKHKPAKHDTADQDPAHAADDAMPEGD